jgi:hypothetical protein
MCGECGEVEACVCPSVYQSDCVCVCVCFLCVCVCVCRRGRDWRLEPTISLCVYLSMCMCLCVEPVSFFSFFLFLCAGGGTLVAGD